MIQIHELGIAVAALAFTALGAQAQTLETNYPVVGGTTLAAAVDSRELQPAEPLLVQSNAEGPKTTASAGDTKVSSEQVRSQARVRFLLAPDVDPV